MGAVFFVLIALSFLAGIGTLVYRGIRYASAPPQSSPGVVVTKRSEVRGMSDGPTRTRYYVTFELPDGIPRELSTRGDQHGQLVEGDRGTVAWRDTVLTGFQREGHALRP